MVFASNRTLVLVLGLLSALGPLSFDMYLPALPTIQADLQVSAARVQMTLSAFLVGLAAGTLIYGPLSDRFGRKPVLLAGLLLYLVTNFLCSIAAGIDVLILVRFLNAIGGAAGMVIGRVIIRDYFPPGQTARLISLMAMIMLVGPMISPMIGGQLLVYLGWRSIFVLLTLLGLLGLLCVIFVLTESHPPEKRVRLNLGSSLRAYGSILSDRKGLGYALCGAMAAGVVFTFITSSSFVFIGVYGVEPQHFGYLYGVIITGLLLGNYLNSRITMRVSNYHIISMAHALRLLALAGLFCLVYFGSGALLAGLVALLVPAIGASSLIVPNITADLLHRFPHISGTASAALGTATFGTGALAGVLAGMLHDGTAVPMVQAMLLFALASAAAYWFIAGRATEPVCRDSHAG
jgi:DHA1 family bicyclomycin/chloramphenicol resistance-like MFS transporter